MKKKTLTWLEAGWLTLLPVGIVASFTLPGKIGVVQAAVCGILFGAKLMLICEKRSSDD